MAEEIVQLSDTEGAESIPGNEYAVNAEGRLHDHEESENTQFDDVASEEQQKKKEEEVDKMIKRGDIDKLKLVRPNMLKGLSTNSLEKALDYSSKLTEKAQGSKVQEEELQAIASSMEEYAFHLIEPLKKDHNKKQIFKLKFDHIAAKAVLLKQKKFLAHPVMYELLRDCWKGIFRSERSKFGWMLLYSWTLFDVLLFPIIYFILHLIQVFGRVWPKRANGTYRKSDFYETLYHERFKTPYFIFVRDMLSYFALLVLHFFLCFQPSTLHFIVEEWIILIFFLGRFMMEVYQVVNGFKNVRQTFSNYLSDSWNRLDAVTLTIYAVLLILRVITWSVHTSISNNPLLVGAGYLYGINSMLLTLRVFGHIIELKAKFGTIQIALFQITENIVAVFGQLLAVIIAFSLAISKIRMTQISFEGTPSTVFLESWWSIAKHLLWSFLLEPQVLIVPYERTIVFVQILYVLFLIIAVVLLMNMMIAILTNTYQRAEGNAFHEWSYKKAATIITYCNYHPVPVPLNIISLTFLLMRYLYKKIRCRSSTVDIEKDPKKVALDNDIKFSQMIIELESIYYSVHGDDFPIKDGDQLDHVVKQTDENRHLIGHIAERLFTHGPNRNEGAGSESRQEWDVKGIHILSNRLSYDSRECHKSSDAHEEYHGARYLAPLSPEMPGFEILIEEDSSTNHRLILGVVDEVFDIHKIPEMEGNTVVYYTQKEQRKSFWPKIDHLPEMADRGDLLGCEILYRRECNGNLPVLFTLNGRVIWEGTIENGNPSTGRFYAFVGIGSQELSVRFKLRYLQQESHGVDHLSISISLKQVLHQLSELKQEVQGIRSEIQNNSEKNV